MNIVMHLVCFDINWRFKEFYIHPLASSHDERWILTDWMNNGSYRNDPKFSDSQVWANNADPDQTAPDHDLPCLPFHLHRLDSLFYDRAT